jgi:serine/threonine protein kinase
MAELYLARAGGPQGFNKLVAVKRILPHLSDDRTLVDMFHNEARLAATLHHPNVAQVMDFGEVDGEHYLAMEYVHGPNVRSLLQRAAAADDLPLGCALTIAVGVAAGLHHAHEAKDIHGEPLGIVHRDVSPSNVLVTFEGAVKVIDFGIARAAAHTSVTHGVGIKGKVGYMSPEQCLARRVDRRSDVFALGILVWELTTLERLFVGDNQFGVMNSIANADVVRPSKRVPDYPPELERIVMKALQRDPEDRYPTAHAFAVELEAFAGREGIQLSPLILADYVARMFPDLPSPTVEGITETVRPVAVVDADPKEPAPAVWRTRPWGWAAAALVVGAVGGLSLSSMLGSGDDTAAAGIEAATSPAQEAVPTSAPPPQSTLSADDEGSAQDENSPQEPDEDVELVEVSVDETPRADPSETKKRPRKRKRKRAPKYDRTRLYPPE